VTDALQKPTLIIRQYSQLTPYQERFLEMKQLTEQRDANTPDELWILQHHELLTQGQAGKAEHILIPIQYSGGSDRSWWSGDLAWSGPAGGVFYV